MKTVVRIGGMHCQACVGRVSGALRSVPGIVDARVTLSPPTAEIESGGPFSVELIDQAVRKAGEYSVASMDRTSVAAATEVAPGSLYPLVVILAYIVGTTALASVARGAWDTRQFMSDFMAGFFLVFSFFKMLDLRGFASAYRGYDLVARAWRPWAFAYPFVELGFGVALLVRWQPMVVNAAVLAVMLVGSVGVIRAVMRKSAIRCACLGTVLNLPMTTVTVIEDLGMAAMAGVMLTWR